MKNESRSPFLFEHITAGCSEFIKEFKVSLISSFVFGLLAYMFAFCNKLVNHDEVHCLFSKGATVTSGRWGLGLLDTIFPNYSMPWIYGVLSIGMIAISICLIIHIFQIRNKLLQVLLSGSIMVFPSLIGTFGYMFTSSSYALSFLLAVVSVVLIYQPKKLYMLPALGCMIFSLSIYQAYISVSASLLVLILIQCLLHNDHVIPVIRRGFYFVAFLILSLCLYYAATQIVFLVRDMGFSSYADNSITFHLSDVPAKIILAYRQFFNFFSEYLHSLIPTRLSKLVHILCIPASCFLVFHWWSRQSRKTISQLLLLLALITILPLAINCMYLITSEASIHTLVLYSFTSFYVFMVVLVDTCISSTNDTVFYEIIRKISLNFITFALATIITINIYIANAVYLHMYLQYERSYAFYTSLIADLKMMPEFDEDMKIAVIGNMDLPDYYINNYIFAYNLSGIYGFTPDAYSNAAFLEYYIGHPIPFATEQEIAQIKETYQFSEMAKYPYYGSMQVIDDILVVKLSDTNS